jgi:hypothetical protein
MLLGVAKAELVQFKIRVNLPFALGGSNIIPLGNQAWDGSFANVVTSKKAIADRGWDPLNRNILLHKEIANTGSIAHNQQHDPALTLPGKLNISDGTSGRIFLAMLKHDLKYGGRERHQENLHKGETIQETFVKAKKMSSTIMICRQIHEINNVNVIKCMRDSRDKQKNTIQTTMRK